ncbi:MAG: alpha-xylosidase [Prevotella sp.]|nr:alpha-xylosidase [Prevotella sp.]
MKQTNYHLFDFMDFDPNLKKSEFLWKAWAPTHVEEKNGDIIVSLPYQQQKRQEDMEPDVNAPQQSYTLVIRAYQPDIVRLFTTMGNDAMTESSLMLQMHEDVKRMPLHLMIDGKEYTCIEQPSQLITITDHNGNLRGRIDCRPPKLDIWSDLLPAPQPAPFITVFPDGNEQKGISLSDDHFSPPRYDALPLGFCSVSNDSDKTNKNERATISFRCEADECFAGTGERFRKMDLSGQTFQLKNQDGQGVNNRRCYKNIPFYLSSRMYGAFFHTSDYCKLSLADHSTRSVQFLNEQPTIDVFLIGGTTPERILHTYRMLTGFPSMPPLWSFGIWMSRMTYFSADEVEGICQRLRQEHYPCDVIHLDTGWFRTDWLCEWKFNPERFPDPEGFLQRLKDNGFRVSLWQLPYIAQGAEQLQEAKENRYISWEEQTKECEDKRAENQGGEDTTDIRENSNSNFSALDYAGTIDFTNPAATDWYQNKLLKPLLDMGVVCIKTDFGENIHMNHQYHNGMAPERLNNIYALLYQKAAYEASSNLPLKGEASSQTAESAPIIWARAAWAGCQRYPVHWGGDSESSWAGMAGSLKGGLHFGLSGFAFWSHDVPGFHSVPDFMNAPLNEKVYVRWTQFGVFSSHIRYHGTCKREPWHYPAIAPIVRKWWKLRYRLIPYILEQSEKSTKTGWPIVRALLMHHPNDRNVWHIDDEYYFGDKFLVCPVMNDRDERDIYLPEGIWVDFFTGERLEGNRWHYSVKVPLERMPVYVRLDDMIPVYPEDVDCTDQMDLSKTVLLEISKQFNGIMK